MFVAVVLCLVLVGANADAQAVPDSTATPATSAPADTLTPRAASPDSLDIHWMPGSVTGRPDLLLHASLSFAVGLAVGVATEEPAAAAGTSITLGLAKEIYDVRFDKTDLMADLVGAGLAALVTHWLDP
jgi:hypothetical protein